jgi:hypothetical protein
MKFERVHGQKVFVGLNRKKQASNLTVLVDIKDFIFTIDATLCNILKKCVFELFFQNTEILKFKKKKFTGKIKKILTLPKLVK